MEIYLLRHGKAEDAGPGMSDRDRRLTPEGIESMKAELPGIKQRLSRIDAILTSPYPRAKETAQILAEAYGVQEKIKELDALCMTSAEDEILKKLRKMRADYSVVLVGHAPLLDELVEFLTQPPRYTCLKKGGLAKITFDGFPDKNKGVFHWELKPKELKSGK